jgi:hypothetical protein
MGTASSAPNNAGLGDQTVRLSALIAFPSVCTQDTCDHENSSHLDKRSEDRGANVVTKRSQRVTADFELKL